MTGALLALASLGGLAYTLTPGPAFLMLLGIGAAQGRGPAIRFLAGHFVGDVTWSLLALLAIVGAREIGRTPFDLLGLVCGLYLGWLGFAALRFRAGVAAGSLQMARPGWRGLTFGLTNPKAYTVAVAIFTALLGGTGDRIGWAAMPALLLAACIGFLAGDVLLVLAATARITRIAYRTHETIIVRGSGLVFLGFAFAALANALPGLFRAYFGG